MKPHRKLEVDGEIKELLRALTPEERQTLEESIAANGCLDAVKVWKEKGLVIDGHNRLDICTTKSLPYKIEELSFASRADVFEWIYKHQKGRRNWTPEQEAIALARILKAKQAKAESVAEQADGPPEAKPKKKQAAVQKAVEDVASEQGVSVSDVVKSSKWTQQIDTLKDSGCDHLRTQIITRKIKSTPKDVEALAACTPEQQQAVQDASATCGSLREALGVAGIQKKAKTPALPKPGKKVNIGTAIGLIEDCLNKAIKAIDAASSMAGGETNHSRSVKQHVHSASSSLISWKQAWRNSKKGN